MIVSHAAQTALVLTPAAHSTRTRTRIRTQGRARSQPPINIAAHYRRALIHTELLLTIAAAPRPASNIGH